RPSSSFSTPDEVGGPTVRPLGPRKHREFVRKSGRQPSPSWRSDPPLSPRAVGPSDRQLSPRSARGAGRPPTAQVGKRRRPAGGGRAGESFLGRPSSPPTEARMKSEHWLLGRGNDKLGEGVHHFDLPAVTTCPGATDVCLGCCYARQGRFRTDVVKARLERN